MKVVYDLSGGYPDDIDHYLKYHEMGDDSETNIMFFGYNAINNKALKEKYKHYDRKIAVTGEQPCAFLSGQQDVINLSADADNYFDKVYTICPYTAKWLNGLHGNEKFESAIIPYNINDIPKKEYEKEFDVIYWGNIHSEDHIAIMDSLPLFKSNLFTVHPAHWSAPAFSYGGRFDDGKRNPDGRPYDRYVPEKYVKLISGVSTPRIEMWDVLRKTKIFVVTNTLYLSEAHTMSVKALPAHNSNEAFSHVDQRIVPQMKTRVVEAAFNKTLSLVKKDPWNVVERWFEPEKDYLYYESNEQLPLLIKEISNNWDKYKQITENAYNKAVENYTAQKLFKRFSGE
jgi:hypothetical protein